jgi:hypothetical protein
MGALACGLLHACLDEPKGIGDPCTAEDEELPNFAGYAMTEVSVESRSQQCRSRMCLVNHFQGRVTCPEGQTAEEASGDDPPCKTITGLPVKTAVAAWDTDRLAHDSVYCSCRCDGPDPSANYCKCPSGFSCQHLVDSYGLGKEQLRGSYCVRDGSGYQAEQQGGPTCATDPETPGCSE